MTKLTCRIGGIFMIAISLLGAFIFGGLCWFTAMFLVPIGLIVTFMEEYNHWLYGDYDEEEDWD